MTDRNVVFMLLFQTLIMLLCPTCLQRTLECPWSHVHTKYAGSIDIHSSKGDLNLSTVVMYGTKLYLENEWIRDNDEVDNKVPQFWGMSGEEIKIGCQMINRSTHERSSQISVNNTTSKTTAKLTKSCASERLYYNQFLLSASGLAIVRDYNLH